MRQDFPKLAQEFVANSFTISVIRNMAPRGTLKHIKEFLKKIDFSEVETKEPSEFSQTLDDLTIKFLNALPENARKWGVARKCLNLFFRDSLYNFYLREAFDLAKFEAELEIPLDSKVGHELKKEDNTLPPWDKVKSLTPELSAKFQSAALQVAEREKTHRVHLDVVYWR
jgi:hypothetical protein